MVYRQGLRDCELEKEPRSGTVTWDGEDDEEKGKGGGRHSVGDVGRNPVDRRGSGRSSGTSSTSGGTLTGGYCSGSSNGN